MWWKWARVGLRKPNGPLVLEMCLFTSASSRSGSRRGENLWLLFNSAIAADLRLTEQRCCSSGSRGYSGLEMHFFLSDDEALAKHDAYTNGQQHQPKSVG